jgi:uncharacterized protein
MKKIIIDSLQFFLVLIVMFPLGAWLAEYLSRKIAGTKSLAILTGSNRFTANLAAAIFGGLTPFCVCTSLPLFSAFIQMGAGADAAVAFLLASPLLNISVIALVWMMMGAKTAMYLAFTVILFSTLGGLLVRKLGFQDQIENIGGVSNKDANPTDCYGQMFKNLAMPLLGGALIAGFLHNYVPFGLIEKFNHLPQAISVPLMALIGFPLYCNILALTPVCFTLVQKGFNAPAMIAFMFAASGVSAPTILVLARLMKPRLLIFYLGYSFLFYCLAGFLYNIFV